MNQPVRKHATTFIGIDRKRKGYLNLNFLAILITFMLLWADPIEALKMRDLAFRRFLLRDMDSSSTGIYLKVP